MAKPTIQSATARLRRTFHYPSDADDDSPQSASAADQVLDEQEQESLIAALSLQNRARNAAFLRLLAALPALAALPFVLALLLPVFSSPSPSLPPSSGSSSSSSSSSPGAAGAGAGGGRPSPSRLLALLGLSSLAATGWLLFRLGAAETGFARLDSLPLSSSSSREGRRGSKGGAGAGASAGSALRSSSGARSETAERSGSGSGAAGSGARRTGPAGIWSRLGWATGRGKGKGKGKGRGRDGGLLGVGMVTDMGGKSPLERHLPWLNVGLALLALLTGLVERLRDGEASTGVSPLLLGALPGVVYAAVVGAKVVMAGVDPEQELSGLRYGYKGA